MREGRDHAKYILARLPPALDPKRMPLTQRLLQAVRSGFGTQEQQELIAPSGYYNQNTNRFGWLPRRPFASFEGAPMANVPVSQDRWNMRGVVSAVAEVVGFVARVAGGFVDSVFQYAPMRVFGSGENDVGGRNWLGSAAQPTDIGGVPEEVEGSTRRSSRRSAAAAGPRATTTGASPPPSEQSKAESAKKAAPGPSRPAAAAAAGTGEPDPPPLGAAVECYFPPNTGGQGWELGTVSRYLSPTDRSAFFVHYEGVGEWPEAVLTSTGKMDKTWRLPASRQRKAAAPGPAPLAAAAPTRPNYTVPTNFEAANLPTFAGVANVKYGPPPTEALAVADQQIAILQESILYIASHAPAGSCLHQAALDEQKAYVKLRAVYYADKILRNALSLTQWRKDYKEMRRAGLDRLLPGVKIEPTEPEVMAIVKEIRETAKTVGIETIYGPTGEAGCVLTLAMLESLCISVPYTQVIFSFAFPVQVLATAGYH